MSFPHSPRMLIFITSETTAAPALVC